MPKKSEPLLGQVSKRRITRGHPLRPHKAKKNISNGCYNTTPPLKVVELPPKEPTKDKKTDFGKFAGKRLLSAIEPPPNKRPKSEGINWEKNKDIIPIEDNNLLIPQWQLQKSQFVSNFQIALTWIRNATFLLTGVRRKKKCLLTLWARQDISLLKKWLYLPPLFNTSKKFSKYLLGIPCLSLY